MFRPVMAINNFYHSTHLSLFYIIRLAACLMRSQLQDPYCGILSLYWDSDVEISSTFRQANYIE